VKCTKCGGTGSLPATCDECKGKGKIITEKGLEECDICNGSGKIQTKCGECYGSGRLACDTCGGTGNV